MSASKEDMHALNAPCATNWRPTAYIAAANFDKDITFEAILDTGASFHSVCDRRVIYSLDTTKTTEFYSASGLSRTLGVGEVHLSDKTGKEYCITAHLMDDSTVNLFSVSELIEKGCIVNFNSNGGTIVMPWGQSHQLIKRGALWVWPLNISRSKTQAVLPGQPGIGMSLPDAHALAALTYEEDRDASPFQPALPNTAPTDIRKIHEKLGHCDTAVIFELSKMIIFLP